MSWSRETAVRTVWQEARSEPVDGQRAVCHTIWNRLRAGRWGTTLACVCMAAERFPSPLFVFSGWNAHDPNQKSVLELPDDDRVLSDLRLMFDAAESAADPTGNALCYYNPKIALPPKWAARLTFCGQFGDQLYFRDNATTGARA